MKLCRKCNITKTLDLFKPDGECVGGYRHTCLDCFRESQRRRHDQEKASPAYQERLALARRKHDLKRKYAVTIEAFELLLKKQKGRCAICCQKSPVRRLNVDHNHASGAVRGLLCAPCNAAIGLLKENAKTLASAIRYLKR